jgi:hypothetical protein
MTVQDIIKEVKDLSTMAEEEYTNRKQHKYCYSVQDINDWKTIYERLNKLHTELSGHRGVPLKK